MLAETERYFCIFELNTNAAEIEKNERAKAEHGTKIDNLASLIDTRAKEIKAAKAGGKKSSKPARPPKKGGKSSDAGGRPTAPLESEERPPTRPPTRPPSNEIAMKMRAMDFF